MSYHYALKPRCPHISSTCDPLSPFASQHREAMVTYQLLSSSPEEDEVRILTALKTTDVLDAMQNEHFTELPPEIRNYIYELVLLPNNAGLIVGTPVNVQTMMLGQQPALTRICHQIRSETLPMFYGNTKFIAYINGFDFTELVAWCQQVASLNASMHLPVVTVQVNLLSLIMCLYSLLSLARAWRDIDRSTLKLKIHNSYTNVRPGLWELPDPRRLVVKATVLAEELREAGAMAESKLVVWFDRQMQGLDSHGLRCVLRGSVCLTHAGMGCRDWGRKK